MREPRSGERPAGVRRARRFGAGDGERRGEHCHDDAQGVINSEDAARHPRGKRHRMIAIAIDAGGHGIEFGDEVDRERDSGARQEPTGKGQAEARTGSKEPAVVLDEVGIACPSGEGSSVMTAKAPMIMTACATR